MKIYRAVPNIFFTNKRLNTNNKISSEVIYYKMGYTTFSDKIGHHDFNTLNCQDLQGKYFYLFAEDAIMEGSNLIKGYHRLSADTCSILEYDIPEDVVIKHIGYGDYTYTIMPLLLVESFIEKEDFGTNITSSDKISEKEKLSYLIKSFKDSLSVIREYRYYLFSDISYYKNLFHGANLSSLTDEEIKHVLLNSEFYYTFLNQHCELILSPYITGKILPVNMGFMSNELGDWDKIVEYYQNFGIKCDFSNDHQKFKKELIDTIKYDNQDKEKIKKLLKEEKYI